MRPLRANANPIPQADEDAEPSRSSGVVLRAPEAVPMTRAGLVLRALRIHEALAEAAMQQAALGERDQALRTIDDALALLEAVRDRRPFTRVLVGIGECLVELDCAERADPLLLEAVGLADALPDARLGARARRALGRVWLAVGNPSCRRVLYDARKMFERLGDRKAVLEIDDLLRATAAALMNLPNPAGARRRA
jgi:hypothetical protein